MKYYVLLDAMGIQSYIFETNRLKIIFGSSLALDQWQQDCKETAGSLGGTIYTSAGGNVLAEFTEENKAYEFQKRCCYVMQPPEMEIAWAATVSEPGETATSIWLKLQEKIARYKAGDLDEAAYPATNVQAAPGCLFCGIRPHDGGRKIDDKEICAKCRSLYDQKVDLLNNTGLARLSAYTISQGYDDFPENQEALVTDNGEKDMMAAVVIDLNNMGDRIKETVISEGFEGLRNFSEELQENILSSIEECIAQLGDNEKAVMTQKNGSHAIRIRPLVAAGDDMIFLLPARLWADFTANLLSRLADKNYPACAGVASAKHTFPVNRLVLMAEELCANAKQYIRHINQNNSDTTAEEQCALDWYVHQETSMTGPLEVRKHKQVQELPGGAGYAVATGKPYNLPSFKELTEQKTQWDTIKSNRKLYALYSALLQGPEQTRETLKYVFLRREENDFSAFQPLWKSVNTCHGEYPLWKQSSHGDTTIHSTEITDQLELRWLEQGAEGGNNNE